ncbi:ATP-binding protein [Actinomadura sp. CNU-125]|uniref:ATP-binding protein n=1 Tax=Actinomadura sp. CNU-125 TaxID=1904961 RepID=UPI000A53ADFB|nr:ATP-binding protein [Actinomadura sp. CNU-125]
MTKAATVCGVPWTLENGGCTALPLPPDETIAGVARAHVANLLPKAGVHDAADVTLMVSELATNALQHGTPRSADGTRKPSPGAELWIYRRGDGRGRQELVVKIFDELRCWRHHPRGGPMPEHGRGLDIIDLLSGGRWGHHASRSRLRSPQVSGKATWFAVPVRAGRGRPLSPVPEHAIEELGALLAERGLDDPTPVAPAGLAVGALTVWCEGAAFHWCDHEGELARMPVADITEACEQLVRLHETAREGAP